MKILYDDNIPFGHAAFSTLGDASPCAGREMTSEQAANADLLIVRSVTRVNDALLDGSTVKFVASATSGSDHIDRACLARRGIVFRDALGSNAHAVAEYVVAALLVLARRGRVALAGKTMGVVGVGHVGALVVEKARALGIKVLQNDPPRKRADSSFPGVPLLDALQADIVSFHVPLTMDGPDATRHMINGALFSQIRRGSILIQTSRGEIHDTTALKRAITGRRVGPVVVDVWEHEPKVNGRLISMAALATPHIAGYSWTSKVRGTWMVYEAACSFLGVPPAWAPPEMPGSTAAPVVPPASAGAPLERVAHDAVRAVYDIEADDRSLRSLANVPEAVRAQRFDVLRKNYPVRLEFSQAVVPESPPAAVPLLRGLGFRL